MSMMTGRSFLFLFCFLALASAAIIPTLCNDINDDDDDNDNNNNTNNVDKHISYIYLKQTN